MDDGQFHRAHGHYVGTQPIERITFEALSSFEQARLRGAIIIYRHVVHRTCERLKEIKRQREEDRGRNDGSKRERFGAQAFALLSVTASAFGKIVPGIEGLRVDESREAIAAAIGGSWKSTYPLLQQLAAVGAIVIYRIGGTRRIIFDLVLPAQTEEEKARATQDAAQNASATQESARAGQAKSCLRESSCAANPLQDQNLARARQAKSCLRENGLPQTGVFPPETSELHKARALGRPLEEEEEYRDTHSLSSSTNHGSDPDAVFDVLRSCGIYPNPARSLCQTTSLIDAMALRIMVQREHQNGGWAIGVLKGTGVSDDARKAARRLLNQRSGTSPTSTPSSPGTLRSGAPSPEGEDDDYRIG